MFYDLTIENVNLNVFFFCTANIIFYCEYMELMNWDIIVDDYLRLNEAFVMSLLNMIKNFF